MVYGIISLTRNDGVLILSDDFVQCGLYRIATQDERIERKVLAEDLPTEWNNMVPVDCYNNSYTFMNMFWYK